MPTTPVTRTPRHALAWPAVPTRVGLALLALLTAWGVLGPPAEAAPPCDVPGDFATIQAAVNDGTCATINVAAGTHLGQVFIIGPVTIRGEGQDRTVIDGGGDGPVVSVISGPVRIKGVTIRGGVTPPLGFGGGIASQVTLTVENSTVTDNTAIFGGGLVSFGGTLTVKDSTVTANTADVGGGIANIQGTVTVRNSTVTANTAAVGGGIANSALFGDQGTVTVTVQNSTLAENTAAGDGGGIFNDGSGTVTVRNSTVTANEAGGAGDDIFNQGTLTLTHVTVNECVNADGGTGCPAP